MRAYSVYSVSLGAMEGACLVFANTSKEARKIGSPVIRDWFDSAWIDIGVTWLKGMDFLFDQADKEKLNSSTPHIVERPETCEICGIWGKSKLDHGLCDECTAEYESRDKGWTI